MAYNRISRLAWAADPDTCAVELALTSIDGKWKTRIYDIIRHQQPVRYSTMVNELKDISEKTLTSQLREMEHDGIIKRIVYPQVPPRVEYELTALGKSLQEVIDALENWGKAYVKNINTTKDSF